MNFPQEVIDEARTEADGLDFMLNEGREAWDTDPAERKRTDARRRLLLVIAEAMEIYNDYPQEGPQTEEEELADMKQRAEKENGLFVQKRPQK